MTGYVLSGEADRDIEAIARFTVEHWGWSRAEADAEALHRTFDTLARFPELGRQIDHIRAGYLRFEHATIRSTIALRLRASSS